MRGLNRNKRLVHYALRTGEKIELDEYGNETGEPTPIYGDPVELMCNISAATGSEVAQVFGTASVYNRVICVTDRACPINEDAVVWFGRNPYDTLGKFTVGVSVLGREIVTQHNYIVIQKADSKNGILYALREVSVT